MLACPIMQVCRAMTFMASPVDSTSWPQKITLYVPVTWDASAMTAARKQPGAELPPASFPAGIEQYVDSSLAGATVVPCVRMQSVSTLVLRARSALV